MLFVFPLNCSPQQWGLGVWGGGAGGGGGGDGTPGGDLKDQ